MEYYSAIKKKKIMPSASNMGGLRGYHTKSSKSERERQISYDITYMWNLKYGTNEPIYETERESRHTELSISFESLLVFSLPLPAAEDNGSGLSSVSLLGGLHHVSLSTVPPLVPSGCVEHVSQCPRLDLLS